MISSPQTICFNVFSMVLRSFNHWFQWFSMVMDHWSNNAMVSMYCSPLHCIETILSLIFVIFIISVAVIVPDFDIVVSFSLIILFLGLIMCPLKCLSRNATAEFEPVPVNCFRQVRHIDPLPTEREKRAPLSKLSPLPPIPN